VTGRLVRAQACRSVAPPVCEERSDVPERKLLRCEKALTVGHGIIKPMAMDRQCSFVQSLPGMY